MIAYSGPLPDGQVDTEQERAISRYRAALVGCKHYLLAGGLCWICWVDSLIAAERAGIELGRRQEALL